MRIHLSILAVVSLTIMSTHGEDILPKDWITTEQLEQAERPIQEQLDTGKAMGPTAWDMAAVKDARLLLIYLAIYERLPDDASRRKLKSEQEDWLLERKNALKAINDPKGGSMVSLDRAAKKMEITDIRIVILTKRLEQMKK